MLGRSARASPSHQSGPRQPSNWSGAVGADQGRKHPALGEEAQPHAAVSFKSVAPSAAAHKRLSAAQSSDARYARVVQQSGRVQRPLRVGLRHDIARCHKLVHHATWLSPKPVQRHIPRTVWRYLCLRSNFLFVRVCQFESGGPFALVHLTKKQRACSPPRPVLRIDAIGESLHIRQWRNAAAPSRLLERAPWWGGWPLESSGKPCKSAPWRAEGNSIQITIN